MNYAFFAAWVLAAALTVKVEAMYLQKPTKYWGTEALLALFIWPVVAWMQLTTKHDCRPIGKDYASEEDWRY